MKRLFLSSILIGSLFVGYANADNAYSGMWWNSPAASESGWGINFEHHDDIVFVSWFTYDLNGLPLWVTGTLQRDQASGDQFFGDLVETTGPAFNSVPFDPNQVHRTVVGFLVIHFQDESHAQMDYILHGVQQQKMIEKLALYLSPEPKIVQEVEYNDEREFATVFALGDVARGHLSDKSDIDWFMVEVTSADTGTVEIHFDVSSMSTGYWSVDWYDPNMTIMSGRNIEVPGLEYTFPAYTAGFYYVRIGITELDWLYNGGSYEITINK